MSYHIEVYSLFRDHPIIAAEYQLAVLVLLMSWAHANKGVFLVLFISSECGFVIYFRYLYLDGLGCTLTHSCSNGKDCSELWANK